MRKLTDLETMALARVLTETQDKKARANVTPGVYRVALDVRAEVILNVGEDDIQRVAAKADPWVLLAAAMVRLKGVKIENLVTDSESVSVDAVSSIKSQAQMVVGAIRPAKVSPSKGRVTVARRIAEVIEDTDKVTAPLLQRRDLPLDGSDLTEESVDLSALFASMEKT